MVTPNNSQILLSSSKYRSPGDVPLETWIGTSILLYDGRCRDCIKLTITRGTLTSVSAWAFDWGVLFLSNAQLHVKGDM